MLLFGPFGWPYTSNMKTSAGLKVEFASTQAGLSSCVLVSSSAGNIMFDCGTAHKETFSAKHIFITHGHIDHIGALISFARAKSLNSHGSVYYVPEECEMALRSALNAFNILNGDTIDMDIRTIKPGDPPLELSKPINPTCSSSGAGFKRRFKRPKGPCRYGRECVSRDCNFTHPEKESDSAEKMSIFSRLGGKSDAGAEVEGKSAEKMSIFSRLGKESDAGAEVEGGTGEAEGEAKGDGEKDAGVGVGPDDEVRSSWAFREESGDGELYWPPDPPGRQNQLRVLAFRTLHRVPAQGYAIINTNRKLKSQYIGSTPEKFISLQREGVNMYDMVERVELVYTGDTVMDPLLHPRLSFLFDADILIMECTYLDGDPGKTAKYKHIHIDNITSNAHLFKNKQLLIVHISQKYSLEQSVTFLRNSLRSCGLLDIGAVNLTAQGAKEHVTVLADSKWDRLETRVPGHGWKFKGK
jgi:ribonuclease BN (tRNA processing enzyme)